MSESQTHYLYFEDRIIKMKGLEEEIDFALANIPRSIRYSEVVDFLKDKGLSVKLIRDKKT